MESHSVNRIVKTVECMQQLLIAGDYNSIEKMTGGVRLSAQQIHAAIETYHDGKAQCPSLCVCDMDIIEITNCSPRSWSVNVPFFGLDGHRSDLTMSLTLIDANLGGDVLKVELDDIHVL